MLDSGSLYFARVDTLGDPFEGTYPRALDSSITPATLTEANVTPEWSKLIQHQRSMDRGNRHNVYVNCWHVNEGESDAMWKLYLKGSEGIAIRTTVGRLCQSFDPTAPELIQVGRMKYLEWDRSSIAGGNVLKVLHAQA